MILVYPGPGSSYGPTSIELREFCDQQLRKDLSRNAGGSLTHLAVEDVLKATKRLAVREENIMVARVTLHDMPQDHDEPVRAFGARLRGQAGVCKFIIECPHCKHDVNYTEPVLCDSVTRGLADQDIQLDIMGDRNQNMKLEEIFHFVEAKESGKRSASRLLHAQTQGAEAASSSYWRHKKESLISKHDNAADSIENPDLCTYCGKKGHGARSHVKLRQKECTAYGHTCKRCGKNNHFEHVCLASKRNTSRSASDEHEGAVFDSLCTASDEVSFPKVISLDHHLYSRLSDTWTRTHSIPQPFADLTVSTSPDDYSDLGFNVNIKPKSAIVSCMADIGCQSCLSGMKTISRLGIGTNKLIPVTLKMHAANNKGIRILGAVISESQARITMGTNWRHDRSRTSPIALTSSSSAERPASSWISTTFPSVGEMERSPETVSAIKDNNTESDSSLTSDCDCLRRETPPPLPTTRPLPATTANREKLRQFILETYGSSTFNTCEHQPLPMMDGPPLHLMIDPDAKPVAHHTPIPVPIHWQEDVKAGLDRDVRLGVLEPVPVGEPVTWCHRMVVSAKKNGKPRRTVDMQPLNQHAIRETHHTQSPFHQARSVPPGTLKTVFDAWNGYHSVPLKREDQHLTTFITPWGRYRYRTAPQRYIA